ncbi:MAG: redoxin domain-containing protein [Ferruginibacter sp.]
MRKWIFIIAFTCLAKVSLAQSDSSLIYLRFPTIPPFSITKVPDSTTFTKNDLSKRKATLIFIFSPDCEHCQHETRALLDHIKLFKKVQIIMATPLEHDLIKQFYELYKIGEYPNIIMGRDPTFFFGSFYKVQTYPAIFLYNKKGKFVKAFDGTVPVEQIAEFL